LIKENVVKKNLESFFRKQIQKNNAASGLRRFPSAQRLALLIGLGVGLIVSANLGLHLYQTNIVDVRVSHVGGLAQQHVSLIATNVGSYIRFVEQKIEFYTAQKETSASLISQDLEFISGLKKKISSQVNGVVGLRYIPKGEVTLDAKSYPPIRFSEMEMINRVLAGEEVFSELARIDNAWLMNFVFPVLSAEGEGGKQDAMPGVLFLSLSSDELKARIVQRQLSLGRMELYQKFPGSQPVLVISVGDSRIDDPKKAKVVNSHWGLVFSPSGAMVAQIPSISQLDYLAVIGACLAVLFVSVLLAFFAGRYIELYIRRKQRAVARVGMSTNSGERPDDGLSTSLYKPTDVLEVELNDSQEELLGLEEAEDNNDSQIVEEVDAPVTVDVVGVPESVFRAYDIRGLAKEEITNELAKQIGQALGSEALDCNQTTMIVARDARLHSPGLQEWLVRGILSTGCNVLNIGTVPTPLMYFATETLEESQSGVIVTASHNGKDHNGFKIVIDGNCRSEEDIQAIRTRILNNDVRRAQSPGQEHRHDIIPSYIDTIFSDVALAGDVSIVLDAGNGVTGVVAPRLFEELGCEVTPLFCDLDGSFPNRAPDTSQAKHLEQLIAKVKEVGADIGVAFDGDGDRLAVVTPKGDIIWPDRLLMMFAKDIISRNPGADVVFDVKCTRHLNSCITSYGGRPVMWKTGHAPMKNKMKETGALVGGEYSGHIFIQDRWFGFDDGMYAAARLIEILSLQGESIDVAFEAFPISLSTPEIRVSVDEAVKFDIVERLKASADFADGKVTTIDGIRVDFHNGWGLVRASNTSAELTLRFEGDDSEALHQIKSIFVKELKSIDRSLVFNWGD